MCVPGWAGSQLAAAEKVVAQVAKLKAAAAFLEPVTEAAVPGYSKVVQQPMDLGTVQAKLKVRGYPSAGGALCSGLLPMSQVAADAHAPMGRAGPGQRGLEGTRPAWTHTVRVLGGSS